MAMSEQFEYRLSKGVEYYKILNDMMLSISDNKMIVKLLKNGMPKYEDVLDYHQKNLKYYVDKCVKHNVPIVCTIKNYEYMQRQRVLAQLKDSFRTMHINEFNNRLDQFIVSDWVQIDPFLKNLNLAQKGIQHKMCNDLIIVMNDRWNSTYYHNSNKDCKRLVEKFSKLNLKSSLHIIKEKKIKYNKFSVKYETQMFENITQLPKKMAETIDKFGNTCDTFEIFMEKMNAFIDSINEKFTTLASVGSVFVGIAKFMAMGYLLSQPQNQNVKNILALLTMIVPMDAIGRLPHIVVNLSRALQEIIVKFVPGVFKTQMDDNQSMFGCFFELTKNILRSIFSTVPEDRYNAMRIGNSKIKVLIDYLKNAGSIVEYICKLLEKLIEFLGEIVLKYYGYFPKFMKSNQLVDLIDRYTFYKENNYDISARTNKQHTIFVKNLYRDVLQMENKMQKKAVKYEKFESFRVVPYLRIMGNSLEKTIENIPPHLKDDVNVRRCKPYWLYIHGEPRVGKSAVFQPYIINELVKVLHLVENYQDPHAYCYARNCGDEFWENYFGQPVVTYNDLCQGYSDENKMNTAMVELTNAIDDYPWSLNMGALERKGCTFFVSPLVVSNAQGDLVGQTFVSNKCWSKGEHLYARRNLVVELKLNPIYKKEGDVCIDFNKVNEAMKSSSANIGPVDDPLFPKDMYTLKFTDPLTGVKLCELDFENGVQYILNDAQIYMNKQLIFKDRLFSYFATTWEVQGDEAVDDDDFDSCFADFANRICICVQKNFKENLYSTELHFANMKQMIYNKYPLHHRCPCLQTQHEVFKIHMNFKYDSDVSESIRVGDVEKLLSTTCQCIHNLDEDFWEAISSYPNYVSLFALFQDHYKIKHEGLCLVDYNDALMWLYNNNNKSDTLFELVKKNRPMKILTFREKFLNVVDVMKNGMLNVKKNLLWFVDFEMLGMLVQVFVMTFSILWITVKLLVPKGKQKKKKEKVEAESSEGHNKVRKPIRRSRKDLLQDHLVQTEVQETIDNYKINSQGYDDTNVAIENKLLPQFARLNVSVLVGNEEKNLPLYGNLLCVGGDIFVMPRHYWLRFEELVELNKQHDAQVIFTLVWNKISQQRISFVDMNVFKPSYDHSIDVIFVQIKGLCTMKDLRKFFIKESDEVNLFGCYLYGLRSKKVEGTPAISEPVLLSVGSTKLSTIKYDTGESVDKLYGTKYKKYDFYIPQCYIYNEAATMKGDCGMLLVHIDNSTACRRILGIHTAGSTDGYMGVTSPIYQEDIDEAFEYFNCGGEIVTQLCDSDYFDWEKTPQSLMYQDLLKEGLQIVCRSGFYTNEKGENKKIKVPLPSKSKISKSVVFDMMEEDFGPHTQEPARLRKAVVDGIEISPFKLAVKKLVQRGCYVPNLIFDNIKIHISETIIGWQSNFRNSPRLLTDFESVNGMVGLNPLDMRTSPGFPFILEGKMEGKKPWFICSINDDGKYLYVMRDNLIKIVQFREEQAKKGVIVDTIFVDTMKDETRTLDKISKGKTRIFQVGPMDLSILMRKYFGFFIAHCHATYIEGEFAIGINATSYDWTLKIKNMLLISNKFVNGDYSNYDASLWHQLSDLMAYVVNEFYGDGPINALVRRVLIKTCMSSYHLVDDMIIFLQQGNPSGNVLTTILNVVANMFCVRYAFLKLTNLSLYDFDNNIKAWFYGDDNLIVVHESIVAKFNMVSYSDVMTELGLVYTTPDKSAIQQLVYDVQQIEFLKRKFVKHDRFDLYLAQLNWDVVLEIPRWSESDPTNMVDQMQRFNASLIESANCGVEKFNKVRKCYVEYCKILNEVGYNIKISNLFTYYYSLHLMYPQFFDEKCYYHVFDLTMNKQGCSDVLQKYEQDCNVGKLPTYTSDDCTVSDGENICTGNFLHYFGNSSYTTQSHEGQKQRVRQVRKRQKKIETQMSEFETLDLALGILKNQIDNLDVRILECEKELIKLRQEIIDLKECEIETQMDEEDRKETVKQLQISKFYDQNQNHEPNMSNNFYGVYNSMPNVDLMNFLKRPIQIASFDWASTDALGASMGTWKLPDVYVLDPFMGRKLNNIAFWRPSFRITVRVNASKMHYGRLVFCWIPAGDFIGANYVAFENAFGNNWYQASANGQQTLTFDVPWTSYKNLYEIRKPVDIANQPCMAQIYSYVSAPLQIFSGVAPNVRVTIFCEVLEPNLRGFVADTSVTTQMDDSEEKEAQSATQQGSLVPKSESVMNDLVSNIRGVALGIKSAQNIVSNIGQLAAGLSIPTNLSIVQPMNLRQPRWLQMNDVPNTLQLGPTSDMAISKDFSLVNSRSNEMDIVEFCKRPGLIYSGEVTVNDSPGTLVFDRQVSPAYMWVTNKTATAPVIGGYYGTPMQFIARYFTQWRGSLNFHISFIASPFHSCRLRLVYDPYAIGGSPTGVTQTVHYVNINMDLTEETEYSFTIPFMQESAWCAIDQETILQSGVSSDIRIFSNGFMFLQVINTLTGGAATVNPIKFQVFVSAGDDLQFANPSVYKLEKRGTPYVAPALLFEAQMDEVTECQLPSSSMNCLRDTKYDVIGGITQGYTFHRVQTACEVTSIRQLCNMISNIFMTQEPDPPDNDYHGIIWRPGGQITLTMSSYIMYNYLLNMMQVFRFYRGGTRVIYLSNAIKAHGYAYVAHYKGGGDCIDAYSEDLFSTTFVSSLTSQGFAWFPDTDLNIFDVTLPYFSRFNCRLIQWNPTTVLADDQVDRDVLVTMAKEEGGLTNWSFRWGLGAGDDFLLGFQLGIPKAIWV